MSIIRLTNTYAFEQWLLQNHPDLFEEWELEASEFLDLDEWLDRQHYWVLRKWWQRSRDVAEAGAGGTGA